MKRSDFVAGAACHTRRGAATILYTEAKPAGFVVWVADTDNIDRWYAPENIALAADFRQEIDE